MNDGEPTDVVFMIAPAANPKFPGEHGIYFSGFPNREAAEAFMQHVFGPPAVDWDMSGETMQ